MSGWLAVGRAAVTAATVFLTAAEIAGAEVPAGFEHSEAYISSADGTRLHADVLTPADLASEERTPVLMNITPYAAQGNCAGALAPPTHVTTAPPCSLFHTFADSIAKRRNYSVVVVDLRGHGGSEGCPDYGGSGEQADVKAAVEWAAVQPWSNGKVALAGTSYEGHTGLMALATNPKGLAGVVAMAGWADLYTQLYMDRVPHWMQAAWHPTYGVWGSQQPGSVFSTPEYHAIWLGRAHAGCGTRHASELGDGNPDTPFWHERDLRRRVLKSDVPVFGSHGFLDYNVAPDQLPVLRNQMRRLQALWMGQFNHTPIQRSDARTRIGRVALPEIERFLRQVLEGEPPALADPKVTVQEAPTLRWRAEDRWPPADVKRHALALLPGSYTDRSGNGAGDEVVASGVPALPASNLPSGVGTWTITRPLPHEVHLAGRATLAASTEGPREARLVTLLYDIDANGSALLISRGATLVGGGVPSVTLYPQDWRIAKGHRIGILISAADDSWWIPHEGTDSQVRVKDGTLELPALRYVRDEFLEGGPGTDWERIKRPIQIEASTIVRRTSPAQLPPRQVQPPRRVRSLSIRVRPRRIRAARPATLKFLATSENRPVRSARIRFAGKRARTNRRGLAVLVRRIRQRGRYRATATKRGFRTARTWVRVARTSTGHQRQR